MNADAELRIRRMRVEDLEQVFMIAGSLKDAPQWPRTVYLSALKPDSTPRRFARVAEDFRAPIKSSSADGETRKGRVVGFAIASLLPPRAELETIVVSAPEQRRGIGRELFSAMTEELRAAGVSEFMLEVRESNQRALDFYRSLGWEQTGRRPRYYADPEEDAVLMSLVLG
jgi:[ribosomal protein S18]-alanine N-acetyltransferase